MPTSIEHQSIGTHDTPAPSTSPLPSDTTGDAAAPAWAHDDTDAHLQLLAANCRRAAAVMLLAALPDAAKLILHRYTGHHGETTMDLVGVRDAERNLLWYGRAMASHPDAVNLAHAEATGGPACPALDPSVKRQIEGNLALAHDLHGSVGFTASDEDFHPDRSSRLSRFAIALDVHVPGSSKGRAVTFDAHAFRVWCQQTIHAADGTETTNANWAGFLSDVDLTDRDAGRATERAVLAVKDQPSIWTVGDGITEIGVWPSADAGGCDGGATITVTVDGIQLSAGHLPAHHLIPRAIGPRGSVRLSPLRTHERALHNVATHVNRTVARYRAAFAD